MTTAKPDPGPACYDLGYARVSTTAQDLTRQLDALAAAGIPGNCVYVDKRTGRDMDRDGLRDLLRIARPGDRINVLTLDRLGRSMRETLNLVHELTQRGVYLRTLGDALRVDTSDPGPGTDMAIALLSFIAEMELVYQRERVASARAARDRRGQKSGPPSKLNPRQRALLLRAVDDPDRTATHDQLAADFGISRATLYREISKARLESDLGPEAATER